MTAIDESDEKEYWLSQTPEKRLEAMEMMRRATYGYTDSSQKVERVLEIVKID